MGIAVLHLSYGLAVIALIGATITMQLVLARKANDHTHPAAQVYDDRQIKVLEALQARLQGRGMPQCTSH